MIVTDLNEKQVVERAFLTEMHLARFNYIKQHGQEPNYYILHPTKKIVISKEFDQIMSGTNFRRPDGMYFSGIKIMFSENAPEDEILCGFMEKLKII